MKILIKTNKLWLFKEDKHCLFCLYKPEFFLTYYRSLKTIEILYSCKARVKLDFWFYTISNRLEMFRLLLYLYFKRLYLETAKHWIGVMRSLETVSKNLNLKNNSVWRPSVISILTANCLNRHLYILSLSNISLSRPINLESISFPL